MNKTVIISATKTIDNIGSLQPSLDLERAIKQKGLEITRLTIDPLSADWHEPEQAGHFRSGCAPLEALNSAKALLESGVAAVLISGEDNIKSGYLREQRLQLMAVYGDDYPLTQAYTDLAAQFIQQNHIDGEIFKHLSKSLFENYLLSYKASLAEAFNDDLLPQAKWYEPITSLFRGVDCANPLVDFSGRVLLCSAELADELLLPETSRVTVTAVGLAKLAGDGPSHITEIANYQHLESAYEECCRQANIDFTKLFLRGDALLEIYTCYPVVPMAFLLASRLVSTLEDIPNFLQRHQITVTGGMNLARAPWNNPALNGIITMVQRMISTDHKLGMVHGNGGLGYRQGVVILQH